MRLQHVNASLAALCAARGDFAFIPQRFRASFMPGVGLFEGEGGAGGAGEKTYTKAELDAQLAGLKAKNDELLGANRQLKDRVKPFEGIDADPETIKTALAARETAEETRRKKEGEFESWRGDITTKHKQALDAKDGEIAKVKTSLEKHLVDDALGTAIATAGGNLKLLRPALRNQVRMVEQDGEFVARVVDAKGNARLKDGAGNFMSIDDLITETKANEEFGIAFKASGAAGGGAGGSGESGGSGAGATGDIYYVSPEDAQVPSKYRFHKDKATKEGKELVIGKPGR